MEIEAIYFNVSNAFSWFTSKEVEVVTVLEWPSASKSASPRAVPDFQRHVAPAEPASPQELAPPSCAATSVSIDSEPQEPPQSAEEAAPIPAPTEESEATA